MTDSKNNTFKEEIIEDEDNNFKVNNVVDESENEEPAVKDDYDE
jgi:hypothetical protein